VTRGHNGPPLQTQQDASASVSITPGNAAANPVLTAQELSQIVPLHPVTILRWAREGRIPHRRLGPRKIVFLLSDVNAWLDSNRAGYTEQAVRAA